MFCGQSRIIEDEFYNPAFNGEDAARRVFGSGYKMCDHLATCLCDCQQAREYAYKFSSRQNAYDDIEYLLGDKEEVIPGAKNAADLLLEGDVQSVTFKWDKVAFKVLKGKDSLKVEKTVTTKESLES